MIKPGCITSDKWQERAIALPRPMMLSVIQPPIRISISWAVTVPKLAARFNTAMTSLVTSH